MSPNYFEQLFNTTVMSSSAIFRNMKYELTVTSVIEFEVLQINACVTSIFELFFCKKNTS